MCNQLYPERQPYNILPALPSNRKGELATMGLWSIDKPTTVNGCFYANGKEGGKQKKKQNKNTVLLIC